MNVIVTGFINGHAAWTELVPIETLPRQMPALLERHVREFCSRERFQWGTTPGTFRFSLGMAGIIEVEVSEGALDASS